MPVYTGRNLTLSIGGTGYSGQITSAKLVPTQNTNNYVTLSSNQALVDPVTWTLEVTGFQDWLTGATPGFSSALYTAAVAGTAIAFSMVVTAGTARTITGNVRPVFSDIGGDASAPLEQTYSFPVDGSISIT